MLGSTGEGASSTMLHSAIDSALDDLARLVPKASYVVMNLVPNQSEYSVPDSTYRVLDVVFPDFGRMPSDFECMSSDFAVSFGMPDEYPPHSHSMWVIEAQKWEQFNNLFGYDWDYDMDSKTLTVIPAPTSSGKMALKLSVMRTVHDLPVRLEIPLRELAVAEAMRSLAATVGSGITSVPIGIGTVSFDAEKLNSQADLIRKRAIEKLGTGGGAVVVG